MATVEMISNAGHQIYLENPRKFNETVLSHLETGTTI